MSFWVSQGGTCLLVERVYGLEFPKPDKPHTHTDSWIKDTLRRGIYGETKVSL